MSHESLPSPARSRVERAILRLQGGGLAGAILAFLLIKLAGLGITLLWPLKSAKFAPLVLLCCAEVSWLFGGTVGLLVVLQWLVHELAHLHVSRRFGHMPGLRSLTPFVGVYLGTTAAQWPSREAEATVAIAGVLAGLCLAFALHVAGSMSGDEAMVLAARLGFMMTLIHLLPFRPFDGGRIFPGLFWSIRSTTDPAEPMRMGSTTIRLCGWLVGLIPAPVRRRLAVTGSVLGDGLVAALAWATVIVTLSGLALPAGAFMAIMLAAIIGLVALFAAVLSIDPRHGPAASRRLLPRNGQVTVETSARPLPWTDRSAPRAAFCIYAAALLAAIAGSF
ncbi:MAG TPA: hypothetical protein PLQ11_00035 [Beijerinckiaceae bacterium]|nr:hypothetical protein [Beijerinckiaceae bacterium]